MKIKKFRGKRLDNGEYVFGDLIQLPPVRIINESGEYPINPESVAQFVLKDMDGKELYEGDHIVFDDEIWIEDFEYAFDIKVQNSCGCFPYLKPKIFCSHQPPSRFQYVDTETFERSMKVAPSLKKEYYKKVKETKIVIKCGR